MTKFYRFDQNNSGGKFIEPSIIFIEANSADEANQRAIEETHIYFDPEYTIDCDCCGTRWSPAYETPQGQHKLEYSEWDVEKMESRTINIDSDTGVVKNKLWTREWLVVRK